MRTAAVVLTLGGALVAGAGVAASADPGHGKGQHEPGPPEGGATTTSEDTTSPYGQAPESERPTNPSRAEQREMGQRYVDEAPDERILCEKEDGSFTVLVLRKVDKKSQPTAPAEASCKGSA